ncbi:hypothetical protein ZIOFF_023988 [Zingiber officinale]|uniref:Terpene synthase metal-binding domain-containing protein n=1 Tax=Zingiber officinale TaxID=94328 RepID=A0A8J5GTE4_ZINOF|nr:hypothetical protein ZIOFF_023988 [Zingiber officinale]
MSLQAFQNHIQIMELVDTPSIKVLEDVVVDRQVAGFDPNFWDDYFITNKKSQMALQAFQNHIQVMELVDTPSLKVFEDVVVDRQVAGFDPSFWGDYFITNQKSQSEAWMNERAEELKNEVRSMFQNVTGILQTMNLIDIIQLLGLDYHFMEEIAKALDHLKDVDMSKYGLYEVALHFRLLRQKGFNISSDVFKKYKDKEGKFMEELKDDAKGLLSLYNAAYFGTKKETILDEAISFTKDNLTSLWNPNEVDQLPEYLRDFFLKMLNIFQEFENELAPEEKFRILYLKEEVCLCISWKIQSQSYFKECQWRDDNYVPKLEEHMRVSIISVGFVLFYCGFLSGMEGAVATKDAFEWFASFPKIIEACATIIRITNDITSMEREQKGVHVASTVDCYMKEYGTSKDVACENLLGFVEDAWKTINEELLTETRLSREVIELSFHSAQTTEFVYKHVDAFTEPNTTMKENIFSLFVHPIPI